MDMSYVFDIHFFSVIIKGDKNGRFCNGHVASSAHSHYKIINKMQHEYNVILFNDEKGYDMIHQSNNANEIYLFPG